jgi:hypothetical protein
MGRRKYSRADAVLTRTRLATPYAPPFINPFLVAERNSQLLQGFCHQTSIPYSNRPTEEALGGQNELEQVKRWQEMERRQVGNGRVNAGTNEAGACRERHDIGKNLLITFMVEPGVLDVMAMHL